MAPTAKVVAELNNVKENLESMLSDIGSMVGLLKRKERSIVNTVEKVEKVCQLLKAQEVANTTEDAADLHDFKKVTKDGEDPLSDHECTVQRNVEKRIDQDIQEKCRDLQLESLVLDVKVLSEEQSLKTASVGGSNPPLPSRNKNDIDTLVDEKVFGTNKNQNVVDSLAKLGPDKEDAESDCDSVVSVRPSVKRPAVPLRRPQVASRGEVQVTKSKFDQVKVGEVEVTKSKFDQVKVGEVQVTKSMFDQVKVGEVQVTKSKFDQIKVEGSNCSKYVDYHDPQEELFLREMPPENQRGNRRDPVELTDLQILYLLGPGARGLQRVSTRARVGLRMRVHKGRNGMLVYGTSEAIDKAKDMLGQITKQVIKGDEGRCVTYNIGRLISETAGVVVQVREENGQDRVTELIGLPAGIQKAREMIKDSIRV